VGVPPGSEGLTIVVGFKEITEWRGNEKGVCGFFTMGERVMFRGCTSNGGGVPKFKVQGLTNFEN